MNVSEELTHGTRSLPEPLFTAALDVQRLLGAQLAFTHITLSISDVPRSNYAY